MKTREAWRCALHSCAVTPVYHIKIHYFSSLVRFPSRQGCDRQMIFDMLKSLRSVVYLPGDYVCKKVCTVYCTQTCLYFDLFVRGPVGLSPSHHLHLVLLRARWVGRCTSSRQGRCRWSEDPMGRRCSSPSERGRSSERSGDNVFNPFNLNPCGSKRQKRKETFYSNVQILHVHIKALKLNYTMEQAISKIYHLKMWGGGCICVIFTFPDLCLSELNTFFNCEIQIQICRKNVILNQCDYLPSL